MTILKLVKPKIAQNSQNEQNKIRGAQNLEGVGQTSDTPYENQNTAGQANPNLIMQMLASNLGGQAQQQTNSQQNFANNSNFLQNSGQMGGMFPQGNMAINSQSLILLQRIIQTTPEIQILHQQEQLALYQIQQSIKAALHQNLGQEVISHLVMEYQKTQEQHQMQIQAAIQKKLTMILCQNNTPFMFNQQQSHSQNAQANSATQNSQNEQHVESSIEKIIEKYRRSSYHLGIAYYIQLHKQAQMQEQKQHQQQTAQSQPQQHNMQNQNLTAFQNLGGNLNSGQNQLLSMMQAISQQRQMQGLGGGVRGQNTAASPPSMSQLQQLAAQGIRGNSQINHGGANSQVNTGMMGQSNSNLNPMDQNMGRVQGQNMQGSANNDTSGGDMNKKLNNIMNS
jgi:hypothetical protein